MSTREDSELLDVIGSDARCMALTRRSYRRWSGVNAEMMENVTTTLADVHEFLHTVLLEPTVLCGHSLENDLIALKVRMVAIVKCCDTVSPLYSGFIRM